MKAIDGSNITFAWQCAGTRPPCPNLGPVAPFAGALARLKIVLFNVSVHEMDFKGVWMAHKATNTACSWPTGQAPPLGPERIVGVNHIATCHMCCTWHYTTYVQLLMQPLQHAHMI